MNETLLGRAYDKAEKAVSNTKVAKAVGKTAEKAGQAVAKTAVGKAVTKTVAKTAGTAVGKSVLKKIPLVSLGAGAYLHGSALKTGIGKAPAEKWRPVLWGVFRGWERQQARQLTSGWRRVIFPGSLMRTGRRRLSRKANLRRQPVRQKCRQR